MAQDLDQFPSTIHADLMNDNRFWYRAKYHSNYDGDTIRFLIDMGFGHTMGWDDEVEPFRLYGINTPEVNRGTAEQKAAGRASRDWVKQQCEAATDILIRSVKDRKGKYGRYLAVVYLDGVMLNRKIVEEGHGIYEDY